MDINKVLIVPDSFKGTISSQEICRIIGDKFKEFIPKAEIVTIPTADAGAAGGIGGGLAAFFNCSLESGIQIILDRIGFEEIASGYDLILTG